MIALVGAVAFANALPGYLAGGDAQSDIDAVTEAGIRGVTAIVGSAIGGGVVFGVVAWLLWPRD